MLQKKYYVKKYGGCGAGLSLHSLHKHISITYALYALFPMERRREAARFLGFIQLKIIWFKNNIMSYFLLVFCEVMKYDRGVRDRRPPKRYIPFLFPLCGNKKARAFFRRWSCVPTSYPGIPWKASPKHTISYRFFSKFSPFGTVYFHREHAK